MTEFKIAAAQVPSIRGDIESNIATHAAALRTAGRLGVSVVVFPELSLTGYEPDLAAELAMSTADERLTALAVIARDHQIQALVGAPLRNSSCKPSIGALWIGASGHMKTYRKMHLGASEKRYFEAGDTPLAFDAVGHRLGISICADSSQPGHAKMYAGLGADIYAAGVFLKAEWYETDAPRFPRLAEEFGLLTVMANHGASVGTYTSVGKSAIWAPGGALLAEATGPETALVIATHLEKSWRGHIHAL
jgi:predicted amidohydrolase